MTVIRFYGVDRPELFAIEREAMERDGLTIGRLDDLLLEGVGRRHWGDG